MLWFLNLAPIVRRAIIGVLVFFLCVAVGVAWCARDARRDAKRAEAGQTLAEGRTAAGRDASAIRDRADKRDDQTANIVKDGTDEIRNAPDRAAADAAARRRVCQLTGNADPRCRVLDPDPRRMD